MPQIGWFEILIIVSVAIVVIGPKDFPVMLKKVGSWIGSAKRYVSSIQDQVSNIEKYYQSQFHLNLMFPLYHLYLNIVYFNYKL